MTPTPTEKLTPEERARELLDVLRDDSWIRTAADAIVIDEVSRAIVEAEARGFARARETVCDQCKERLNARQD